MTRTQLGYALWKEDPKMIAEARIQAKGVIARRHLWRVLVESWAKPVVEWIDHKGSK